MDSNVDAQLRDGCLEIVALDGVADWLSRLCRDLGFCNATYFSTPPKIGETSFHATTYPDEWVRRYLDQDYFKVDPVLRALPRMTVPLDWSQCRGLSEEGARFFADADAHEIGHHGMTMALRHPSGAVGALSFTSGRQRGPFSRLSLAELSAMNAFGQMLHDRLVGLMTEAPRPMTPREIECLRRLLAGVTPKTIASDLGVSESRVRFLLRSSCAKLGCRTTEQALARAVGLGLLHDS